MPTITFDVPDGALSALRLSPTEFVKEMRVAAAFAPALARRTLPPVGRAIVINDTHEAVRQRL